MTLEQIQQAINDGSITVEIVQDLLAETIPYALIGELVFSVLHLALGLPDPLTAFFSLFSGRPKMQATADEARILKEYRGPVTQLLAMGAALLLKRDIPVSSPSAAPVFGAFFGAAQQIENAIRFGSQGPGPTNLTNATITQALYESGNPEVAGRATLQAIESAWNAFHAGHAIPGAAAYHAVDALAKQSAFNPARQMSRGWAQQYIRANPAQFAGPPPPPPPPQHEPPPGSTPGVIPARYAQQLGSIIQQHPPGRPIYFDNVFTAKFAASWYDPGQKLLNEVFPGLSLGPLQLPPPPPTPATITLGTQYGATVSGEVLFSATFEGGPYPTAHADWFIDGRQVAETPDGTATPTARITVTTRWDSRTVADGAHSLTVKWIGVRGIVHDELTISIRVYNPAPKTPPPPPPPPRCPPGFRWNPQTEACEEMPAPPLPLPWDQWFDPCREVIPCENVGADAIALTQAIANVAAAINQIFRAQQTDTVDPCCREVIAVLVELVAQVAHVGQLLARPPTPEQISPAIESISSAIRELPHVWAALAGPSETGEPGLPATALNELACLCRELTRIADAVTAPAPRFPDTLEMVRQLSRHLVQNYALDAGAAQIATG